ncbi:MAG: AAA family ATPase [Planctomycetota bacterium]
MRLDLAPGNALVCKVNGHRHAWDGTICRGPEEWDCGTKSDFRIEKCAAGIPKCFHLNLFHPGAPVFVADMNGMDWVLSGAEDRLDDQILLFWTAATSEPFGTRHPEKRVVIGAYRVQRSVHDSMYSWSIRPYGDGWTRFPAIEVECPVTTYAGGRYVRSMDRRHVERVFETVARAAETDDVKWFDPGDAARFQHFHASLGGWLDRAAVQRRKRMTTSREGARFTVGDAQGGLESAFAGQWASVMAGARSPAPVPSLTPVPGQLATPPKPTAPAPAPAGRKPLLDAAARAWVAGVYGDGVARALAIATVTKPIVILRGATGVGKSHLARHLVPAERFLLVPVGATWRGREDLLGYVNPVSGAFEPTELTRFLHRSAVAWEKGDRSPWLVVFDEFNLSQPEHWLTDVLSLGQAQEDAQRRIHLGGAGFEPEGGGRPVKEVLLSRAVHIVATINNDHTVMPLSPRVLDRAAVIELELTPKDALQRVGCAVSDELLVTIMDLDDELRGRGLGFSVRTAASLGAALAHATALDMDEAGLLDHVLAHEMLSKVRLHVGDPGDQALLSRLAAWQERHGAELPLCSALLETWDDCLERGQDVVQA